MYVFWFNSAEIVRLGQNKSNKANLFNQKDTVEMMKFGHWKGTEVYWRFGHLWPEAWKKTWNVIIVPNVAIENGLCIQQLCCTPSGWISSQHYVRLLPLLRCTFHLMSSLMVSSSIGRFPDMTLQQVRSSSMPTVGTKWVSRKVGSVRWSLNNCLPFFIQAAKTVDDSSRVGWPTKLLN